MLSNTSYSAEHDRKKVHVSKVILFRVLLRSLCAMHHAAARPSACSAVAGHDAHHDANLCHLLTVAEQ